MRMAAAGLEVVFQPLSVVLHEDSLTFGSDKASAVKRGLMAHNRQLFFSKWQPTLEVCCRHCCCSHQAADRPVVRPSV